MWAEIEKNWGVQINRVVISDIVLSDEQKDIRRTLLEAKKEAEVAKVKVETSEFERRSAVIKAQGEKEILELAGQGIASQVENLHKQGVDPNHATSHLADRIKWEKVGDKTVIIDSSGGGVGSFGAQFAATSEAIKRSNSTTNNTKKGSVSIKTNKEGVTLSASGEKTTETTEE